MGVTTVVNGGGRVVGEVKELVDHVGARQLGASGLQVLAALDGDVDFIPTAAGWLQLSGRNTKSSEGLRCVT